MKKLIIVCEDKLRKYGDFLSQLISLDDDKEDQIIGFVFKFSEIQKKRKNIMNTMI